MTKRQKELTELLIKASDAYYFSGEPIMDDAEFDLLISELQKLEKESGEYLSGSPTRNVGAKVAEQSKVTHQGLPMLSLDKVHSADEIISFVGSHDFVMSTKLDGLSVRATYDNGKLIRLETRGDGIVGQDITFHSPSIDGVLDMVQTKRHLVLDGECIVPNDIFGHVNAVLPESKRFANARNMAAGSLNNLDDETIRNRGLRFVVWNFIEGSDSNSLYEKMLEAKDLGFYTVDMIRVQQGKDPFWSEDLDSQLRSFKFEETYPMDGVVISFDDVKYGYSLGRTDKFFRHSIAYKYEDETAETYIRDIEWQVGRTGTITPVAIFYPVELEGSVIERASLHNVGIMKSFGFKDGDRISVFKANMIIPQVKKNFGGGYNPIPIPTECPSCGEPVSTVYNNGTENLVCENPNCPCRLVQQLSHFVSRDCADIKGLSEETLSKLADWGMVTSPKDLYHLTGYKMALINKEGFGRQAVSKLFSSIEKSRDISLEKFINAIGIPLVGKKVAKDISGSVGGSIGAFLDIAESGGWKRLGLGDAVSKSLSGYFKHHLNSVKELVEEFHFTESFPMNKPTGGSLQDYVFCITGKLAKFKNREELVKAIEDNGGQVATGVTKKVDYLINNDVESTSGKNKKAKELGVKIINEDRLLELIGA